MFVYKSFYYSSQSFSFWIFKNRIKCVEKENTESVNRLLIGVNSIRNYKNTLVSIDGVNKYTYGSGQTNIPNEIRLYTDLPKFFNITETVRLL